MTAILTPPRAQPMPDPPPDPEREFLPGVQALRAIAALLVVTFHLWPGAVPGGFAGVDIFFVISGFLITSHITRETERSGRVHLAAFYARRVKRLFPAAFSVLGASLIGTWFLLPITLWGRTLHEVLASALYFENWALSASSIDYFAAEDPPTAVQHYWSLSVEEQFYIVWPLLFLLVAVLLRRHERGRAYIGLAVPVTVLLGSFLYSGLATGLSASAQYFNTFGRAWEFAAGGVLALTVGAGRLRPGLSRILLWVGLATVAGSGFYLSSAMRFPGWIAVLPVTGTVLTIAAGTPSGFSPSALVRSRPVQFAGTISYSLYLWHWPVIIFFGRAPGSLDDNGVSRWWLLALSFVLAIASTYLIENPVRHLGGSSRAGRGPRVQLITLGLGAVAMALVTAATQIGQAHVSAEQNQAQAQIEQVAKNAPACFGAAALDPAKPQCATAMDNANPIPNPVAAALDRPTDCSMATIDSPRLKVCSFNPNATGGDVALIGDSHAMHWLTAMEKLATGNQWHLSSMTKGSCPFTDAVRTSSAQQANSCTIWNASVQAWLKHHPEVSEIFVSASSANLFVTPDGENHTTVAQQGFLNAWRSVPSTVKRIVVLRDIPRPRVDVVECSQQAVQKGEDVSVCGTPVGQAELPDPEASAAALEKDRRVSVINLDSFFCGSNGQCSPGVGGAFVYRDSHHMTATFNRTLAPYLEAAYKKLGSLS